MATTTTTKLDELERIREGVWQATALLRRSGHNGLAIPEAIQILSQTGRSLDALITKEEDESG